jgi:hypothetical protein
MVVGPKELEQKLTQKDQQILTHLEQRIDEALTERYEGTGGVCINLPDEMPRKFALERLFDKYREAGWTRVGIRYDQRDGNYIEFGVKTGEGPYR